VTDGTARSDSTDMPGVTKTITISVIAEASVAAPVTLSC
jgi:hypothetical protein